MDIYYSMIGVNFTTRDCDSTNDVDTLHTFLVERGFQILKANAGTLYLRESDSSQVFDTHELYRDQLGVHSDYIRISATSPQKELLEEILKISPRMKTSCHEPVKFKP